MSRLYMGESQNVTLYSGSFSESGITNFLRTDRQNRSLRQTIQTLIYLYHGTWYAYFGVRCMASAKGRIFISSGCSQFDISWWSLALEIEHSCIFLKVIIQIYLKSLFSIPPHPTLIWFLTHYKSVFPFCQLFLSVIFRLCFTFSGFICSYFCFGWLSVYTCFFIFGLSHSRCGGQ